MKHGHKIALCLGVITCAATAYPDTARAQNCAGLPSSVAEDFFQNRTVSRVEVVARYEGKPRMRKPREVDVWILAEQGDSAPWIHRILLCNHLNGGLMGLGGRLNGRPLELRFKVVPHGIGYRIRVFSPDPAVLREVARALEDHMRPNPAE